MGFYLSIDYYLINFINILLMQPWHNICN